MKRIYTFILLLASSGLANAQCFVTVVSSTNISCYGLCDGSATLSTVGTPTFTYLWSPGGQTVQNPTDLCPGTNTVVMTDGSSCTATASVTITEPPQLTATSTQTNISACDSTCSGSATVTPSGGTGLYSHSWSTSPVQTSATAVGLCDTIYNDMITDANGCSITHSVAITKAAPLNNSVSVTNTSSTTACDGGAFSSVTGGDGPYTYMWSPGGETTSSIIGQCPGNYTVCVTDSNGCEVCDTITITGPVGIEEIELANGVLIFPNPSNGIFTLQFKSQFVNSNMNIVNVFGKQVFSSGITANQFSLDLSHLDAGIYFMTLNDGDRTSTKKIVIKR